MEPFQGRYKASAEYLERALKCTPGGAQTLSKRASRFPMGAYPTALTRGHGCRVYDVDGHEYIDFICGLACMTLGYGRREIEFAVKDQLEHGISFSLATTLEAEVAEKLCAMIPCAEMARFVKTGSESTEAAIRIARKATGRDGVLTVGAGYHTWHAWGQAIKPEHPGVSACYESLVKSFEYNDLESLDRSYHAFFDQLHYPCEGIAAIILEPCHYEQPTPGFLQGIRERATRWGCVLIFDCMVTGFRWANGGAQEYYGVTPDLACFGKACANGFPLSFVCGKRELMEHADVVSGTFGGEALSLAACNAVLDIYQSEPIIETLWARGEQFQQGFNDMAEVLDVPAVCDGFAVKPRIKFTYGPTMHTAINWPHGGSIETDILAMSLFLQETALRGILWHPAGGNISAAMTEKDIDDAIFAMGLALNMVKKALESGDWSVLQGKPIQCTSFVRKS